MDFSYEGDHIRVTEELSETFDLPAKTIFVLFEHKSDEEITETLNKFRNKLKKLNPLHRLSV